MLSFFVLSVSLLRENLELREFLFHKIPTLVKRKSPDLNQPEKPHHLMEISKSPPVTKSFFPLFRRRLRRKNSNELGDLAKAHNQMTKTKHVFFLYAGINIQKTFCYVQTFSFPFEVRSACLSHLKRFRFLVLPSALRQNLDKSINSFQVQIPC